VLMKFVVPFFVAFGLDVAMWLLGWVYYDRLSLWRFLANLDFQNLLILSMALVTLAILAFTKTGGVELFSIIKIISLAAVLDVAVWALGWLQYAHSNFISGMGTGSFEVTLILAMALVFVAFLVFVVWNVDSERSSSIDEKKQ